jgi:type I restriction enzyme S subunit
MNAIQQLLTDHIDIWTTADTAKKSGRGRSSGNAASVYGIKKLRELILELAVRGKLVPQDAKDEPASELLKRIQAEKAKLIAEGVIKKDKSLSPISEVEKPYDLPKGWEWVRLGTLFDIVYGKGLSNTELTEDGYEVFGANGIIGRYGSYLYSEPQLLISCRGAYSGKPNISPAFCFITSNSLVLQSSWKKLNLRFFYYSLTVADKQKIVTGSAQPQVTTTNLDPFLVVLPPLAEQHRIVAKVDELMALCDQLETQHNNAAEAHEKLVTHLLGTLTQSQNTEDLTAREGGNAENPKAIFGQSNWQRIAAHFDTLFTTDASIEALKQTLLQLAVMGKLVPQDPNDEPASDLLKRIQAEKARLIAEGKIKKDKPLPPITEEEKPFELPNGWKWSRLDELASLITKGSSPKWQGVNYTENTDDVLFVTSENVGSYELLLDSPKYVEKKFNDIEPRSILSVGDFLMNIVGASIGRTAIYDRDILANINQAVCLIRVTSKNLSSNFLLHFFNSATCLGYMFDKQVDNARPNLSMGNIAKFVIPIPPLAEQQRIVVKIDELMALCDQINSRLTAVDKTQRKVADVLVEQAVI